MCHVGKSDAALHCCFIGVERRSAGCDLRPHAAWEADRLRRRQVCRRRGPFLLRHRRDAAGPPPTSSLTDRKSDAIIALICFHRWPESHPIPPSARPSRAEQGYVWLRPSPHAAGEPGVRLRLRRGAAGAPAVPPTSSPGPPAGRTAAAVHAVGPAADVLTVDWPGKRAGARRAAALTRNTGRVNVMSTSLAVLPLFMHRFARQAITLLACGLSTCSFSRLLQRESACARRAV